MRRLVLIVCTAMLAGCVNTSVGGNLDRMDSAYVKEHVTIGKTTKEDVRRLFGEPREILSDSTGEERWIYEPSGGTNVLTAARSILPVPGLATASNIVGASQGSRHAGLLQISFDKRGLVRRWSR